MAEDERQFPLEVIAEPDMPAETDHAVRQLLCRCFPADATAFSARRAWHDSAPAFSVVHRAGANVLGHVGIVRRTVRIGLTPVPVAGVQSLCVDPGLRGTGLSGALMRRSLEESARRGIRFGLLFCVPELERFYRSLGWFRLDRPVVMRDERGRTAPLPAKNIAMAACLGPEPLPAGPIDLEGRDW